jgi:hypothetical protein
LTLADAPGEDDETAENGAGDGHPGAKVHRAMVADGESVERRV